MSGEPKASTRKRRSRVDSAPQAPASEPDRANLPEVSKQTIGGIAGAVVGSVVAGPVGAVIGGVVGAMVGNASAEGRCPIGKTVDNIRAATAEPARRAYECIAKAMSGMKHPTTKPAAGGTRASKPATKKAPASKRVAKKRPAETTSTT